MKPIEIAKDVYWVGVIDWNIRDFHGYLTEQGSTYNAYLILDEKVTLIDTVKKEFADQLLANIGEIIDPKKIDIVISNHTEPDHSGGLPRVLHKIGEDKPLYCSKLGHKNLALHYREKWNYQPVENGGTLNIGRRNLHFLETRMVHWPDSMFTYCPEDKILYSSDGFGQHYAGWERFDDELGEAIMPYAKKYFANILLLYAPLIQQLIKKVTELNLDIRLICPDHGIIWRQDPLKIVQAYADWGNQEPRKKAVVAYDTMWHSTEKMAEAIVAGLITEGIEAKPMHLRTFHRSDVVTEVLDAGALLVGSPTLNNGLYPTVSDFLTYLKGLKPKKKLVGAFGSFGWSGEAVKLINQELEAMKLDLFDKGLNIQFVPNDQDLKTAFEWGKKIGQALKK
ncbi:MAG: FprA family A-type flavoprotein [Deltaproteobacteria bacterium]|nr:FprA family A-type flavoprotein [Deltaproteobacteria bacterium]